MCEDPKKKNANAGGKRHEKEGGGIARSGFKMRSRTYTGVAAMNGTQ